MLKSAKGADLRKMNKDNLNCPFEDSQLFQKQPGIMEMVPGVLLSEEQNIPQEKEKYAAYKSVPIFLKSIQMEKCMK